MDILNHAIKQRAKLINELDQMLMKTHIIPLCDRFKLEYITGMGTNIFKDRKGRIIYHEDIPGSRMGKQIKALSDLTDDIECELRVPVLGNDYNNR